MLELLISWGLGFLAEFLRGALADWRRDRALREAGYNEAVRDAHDAADERLQGAREELDRWNRLGDDGRERLRIEHGHYRD